MPASASAAAPAAGAAAAAATGAQAAAKATESTVRCVFFPMHVCAALKIPTPVTGSGLWLCCGASLRRLAARVQGWWEQSSWDEPTAESDWGAGTGASGWGDDGGGGGGGGGGGENDDMATLAAELDAMLQVQAVEHTLAQQQRELSQLRPSAPPPPEGGARTAPAASTARELGVLTNDRGVVPPSDELPAFYLVTQAEPTTARQTAGVSEERVEQLLEEYKEREEAEGGSSVDLVAAAEDGMAWAGEVYEYEADRGFAKFSKRLARAPQQCVRSARSGALLWPSKRQPKLQKCGQCGVRVPYRDVCTVSLRGEGHEKDITMETRARRGR